MGKGARFWQGRRTCAIIKTISLVLLPWFWWIVFFKLSIVWQMWYISVVRVGVTRSSRDNSNQHLSECVPAPAKSMTHYSCIWCQTNLYYVFTAKQWHPGCFHWNWMFVFFSTFRFIYFFLTNRGTKDSSHKSKQHLLNWPQFLLLYSTDLEMPMLLTIPTVNAPLLPSPTITKSLWTA